MVSITPDDFTIVAAYDRPNWVEITEFQSGVIRIGLVPAGEHTVFFILRCGTLPWADMPFALGRLPDRRNVPVARSPTAGFFIHMELVDLTSHIVCAMHSFTVTPQFSEVLEDQISKQRANLANFSEEKYDAEIAAFYRRYPHQNDMPVGAIVFETAGMKFPKRC